METTRTNQRIGRRSSSPGLTVMWRVPRRTRWRTRMVEEVVGVADVSASGAALVGPTTAGLAVHQLVDLDCGGIGTTARIARIAPAERPDLSCYGVQFVDPPTEMVDLLLSQAGVPHRDDVEDYWNRAL